MYSTHLYDSLPLQVTKYDSQTVSKNFRVGPLVITKVLVGGAKIHKGEGKKVKCVDINIAPIIHEKLKS